MSGLSSHLGSRSIAGLAAALAVAVTALGIGAGVRVPSGQLDLSRPQDAQLLYARLQQASSQVCHWPSHFDARAYGRWQHCYDGALRQAVLQLNSPELLALYREDPVHASDPG